jgi:hypothetical protein
VKRAKRDRLVLPVRWDHKVLPARKASLVLRVLLARRGFRAHPDPKGRQASKELPAHPARKVRQVFKGPPDPKE